MKKQTLSKYIDDLQSKGNYVFLRKNAISTLGISSSVFNAAASRLIQKGRILSVRQGFYVTVPLEYKNVGAIPASWFIDDLMQFHQQPYYVGLLSAATLYGAAHQQSQEFQVITNKVFRPIIVGRTPIHFFVKKNATTVFTNQIKTATGYMRVSTPELTALDLLKYVDAVGQMHNVVTVIAELAEKIDAQKLIEVAAQTEPAIAQRLGYLLDTFANSFSTKLLHEWLSKKNMIFTALIPGKSCNTAKKNQKWKLWINEEVEIDI